MTRAHLATVALAAAAILHATSAAALCEEGKTEACTRNGKGGTRTCTGGTWGICDTGDGVTPACTDGATRACAAAGASGHQTCASGHWGVCVAPRIGKMLLSDRNPALAMNAWGGAADGAALRLSDACTATNPDCTFTYRDGMLLSDRDPALAVNAWGGAKHGTALRLAKACAPDNPDCTWTYRDGLWRSDRDPGLAIDAWGGAQHGADLRLHRACAPDNPDCTWKLVKGGVVPPPRAASLIAAPAGVYTQRYDNRRTGVTLQEHVLTVAAVAGGQFQKLYTIPVTGQVYAQPLLVPQLDWPDGTKKNVLVVATMDDSVQAFEVDDALTGPPFAPVPLWTLHLGQALPSNFMPLSNSTYSNFLGVRQPNEKPPKVASPLPPIPISAGELVDKGYGLYNVNPSLGILSTPVVDAAARRLFLVAEVGSTAGDVENRLFAIDLVKAMVVGSAVIGKGTTVPGASSDSKNGRLAFTQAFHMNRPALLLQNGQVYVALGSHHDTKAFHGWVFAFDPMTLAQTSVFCTTPNGIGAGIWQSGAGIAGDGSSVYAITGNGEKDLPDSDGNFTEGIDSSGDTTRKNFANAFLQLSPSLTLVGSFSAPDPQRRETKQDGMDLGSAGPVLIPGTSILLSVDKESLMFVLDTATGLGMRQIFQAGAEADSDTFGFPATVNGSGYDHHNHSTPVVYRGPGGLGVYFWPERDVLRMFRWNDATALFDCSANGRCDGHHTTLADQQSALKSSEAQGTRCEGCMPGGILSVSAEGDANGVGRTGTGVLWASLPEDTTSSLGDAVVGGALNNVVPGVLRAFDADAIQVDVWNSQSNPGRDGSYLYAKFNPPMVANGRLYLPTFSNAVGVYGLQRWSKLLGFPAPPPAAVAAGQAFTVQAQFVNVGTTTWKAATDRPRVVEAVWQGASGQLARDVAPGEAVTVSLSLKAPAQVGQGCEGTAGHVACRLTVRMSDGGGSFGEAAFRAVQVTGIGGTPEPPDPCPGKQQCPDGRCIALRGHCPP